MTPEYPEHEKLSCVSDKSQTIGLFLDWLLNEQPYHLAVYDDDYYDGHVLFPARDSINELLARYFDIDLQRLEMEKREMLAFQRELNARR